MGEANSSEVFAEKQNNISPKSTVQWLRKNNISEFIVRKHIGREILDNTKELNPNVAWGQILKGISWNATGYGRALIGEAAIGEAFSRGITDVARFMEWGMHSPEVVYMSGSAVLSLIGRRLDYLSSEIIAIEKGQNKYPSEEERQRKLNDRHKESGELGAYAGRIKTTLDEYATQHLPDAANPDYIKALKGFPFMGHVSKKATRSKAYREFKNRNYGAAVETLS